MKNTNQGTIRKITSFYNENYKQQAQNKNFQSIASVISGIKPTANKALYTVLVDNVTNFQKVEVMSNATALKTEYLGGSSNIDGVIVNIASDYIGSNNLSLLDTKGDFGGRLNKEAAASRYIYIRKSTNFNNLFNKEDMNILPRYNLEGKDIEYQFLTFNLPMILINSQKGMGSGHAQKIIGRDPKLVKDLLIKRLKGKKIDFNLPPYFNNFLGSVHEGENHNKWAIKGKVEKISSLKSKITEVSPYESYKSMIKKLDILVDKKVINSYDDQCEPKTDSFLFIIKHDSKFGVLSEDDKLDKLKLIETISENYTCIDADNKVKIFLNTNEIFNYYYDVRLQYIQKRKDYIISKIKQDIIIAESKYIYIQEVIHDNIILKNKTKADIIKQIEQFNIEKVQDSFTYLINMPMHSVSKETLKELKDKVQELKNQLKIQEATTIEQMWLNDLELIKL